MDYKSGEPMELMEEVPLKELGEAELERLVRGWRREAGKRREALYQYCISFTSFCPAQVMKTCETVRCS